MQRFEASKKGTTYGCVVNEEIDVETEGDWNGHQADQLVQLYFTAFLPGELLYFDPIGHLRDKTLPLVPLMLALMRGRICPRLLQASSTRPTQTGSITRSIR